MGWRLSRILNHKHNTDREGHKKDFYSKTDKFHKDLSVFLFVFLKAPDVRSNSQQRRVIMLHSLAVVTGASSGIGSAIAKELFNAGHFVVLTGRNESRLVRLKESLGERAIVIPCDLSSEESTENLINEILSFSQKMKLPLKVLVNNAGIFKRATAEESPLSEWDRQFRTNFFSAVQLTLGLEKLLKVEPSVVINISSTLGIKPIPMTSVYSASKAAMNSWTQSLALEWAPHKVRVVAICPGLVDTPIHDFHGSPEDSDVKKSVHQAQPIGRVGLPKDIANAAAFLASDKASWVTGSLWSVDGGISLL